MTSAHATPLEEIFPACRAQLHEKAWQRCQSAATPDELINSLAALPAGAGPAYLADLARLEWLARQVSDDSTSFLPDPLSHRTNPTLRHITLDWEGLERLLDPTGDKGVMPAPGRHPLLLFRHPDTGLLRILPPKEPELLVLKVLLEKIAPSELTRNAPAALTAYHDALDQAVRQGLVLRPPSLIRRPPGNDPVPGFSTFQAASIFTLQWHITQACDLACKHCYDRSKRQAVTLDRGERILDDLAGFCNHRNVRGQVTFTGGNPLLHPDFIELYRAAARRGFRLAILGNPATIEQLTELLAVQKPVYYQISLEGLERHTDHIRGPGHYRRSLAFLEQLARLSIRSVVMLTLTRDNLDEVLPLARELQGLADLFTFNRLASVGEGARLAPTEPERFASFLADYQMAAADYQVIGLKDNLLNLLRAEQGLAPFGGCAGFGCGAAFNFVALLSDGELHACRKFPSPLGNIHRHDLAGLYDSPLAERYRQGSTACQGCEIRPVCGGCLAVTASQGRDIFSERDPYCWRA